jgi:hypothetical protein
MHYHSSQPKRETLISDPKEICVVHLRSIHLRVFEIVVEPEAFEREFGGERFSPLKKKSTLAPRKHKMSEEISGEMFVS